METAPATSADELLAEAADQRIDPSAALYFRNGEYLNILHDFHEAKELIEGGQETPPDEQEEETAPVSSWMRGSIGGPEDWVDVLTYAESLDGQDRVVYRTSVRRSDVVRVAEVTPELLKLRDAEARAARMGAG